MTEKNIELKKELMDVAEYALELLKTLGATGATVSAYNGKRDELNVDAGEFSLVRTTISSTFSVSALVGNRYGSAGTNTLDRAAVEKACRDAYASAQMSEPDDAQVISPSIGDYDFTREESSDDIEQLYDRITEFMTDVKRDYPLIDIVQFIAARTNGTSVTANSNGTRVFTTSNAFGGSATVCARDGDKVSAMSGVGFSDISLGKPIIDYPETRRTLDELQRQIETVPYEGKIVGTVLFPPDMVHQFLLFIQNNCLSGAALIGGTSPWKDKLGEKVADEKLTVVMDKSDERLFPSATLTNDLYFSKKHTIIENGVLMNFALNQYSALKTGQQRADDDSGLYIVEGGDAALDDIIAGIEDGILVNRFSGGSPSPDGSFSGVAKNSFIIKNGKIGEALSETMIAGSFLDMFNNIVAISSETVQDGSRVMPWMAFNGVTISGK